MGSLTKADEVSVDDVCSTDAILYVNGVRRVLPDGLAHLTLIQYLRGPSASFLSSFGVVLGLDFYRFVERCLLFLIFFFYSCQMLVQLKVLLFLLVLECLFRC